VTASYRQPWPEAGEDVIIAGSVSDQTPRLYMRIVSKLT